MTTPTTDTMDPSATPAGNIPLEVLFGAPDRLAPMVSPDGRRLAWIAPDQNVLNLWVRDLNDPATAKVVTNDRHRGISSFAWTTGGDRLLFMQDDTGAENWRLRDVHLDTGELRYLTPPGMAARGLQVSTRLLDTVLVSLNWERTEWHDVYTVDLTGGTIARVCENPGGIVGFLADHDLRVRTALAATPDGGAAILVRDTEEALWRPLVQVGHEDALTTVPLSFSADGQRLLCITSHEAPAAELVWCDIATGTRTRVHADPDGYDVTSVAQHVDTKEPRLVSVRRERLRYEILDPTIAEDVAVLAQLGGDFTLYGGDLGDRLWMVSVTHDTEPMSFYLYQRDRRQATFLFSHQPALEDYDLAPMTPFEFTTRDGLLLHGYLTLPVRAPQVPLPAVLLVHGGPWVRDTWGFHAVVQWLANRGYAVIQCNYRGSAGYGKDLLNAGDRQWGAAMQDDLHDAVGWAVAQGHVDPARVAIFGSSYGGYAALVGVAFTPHRFACAVAVCPPSDLNALLTSYPPYWKAAIQQAHRRVGNPATDKDFLWSRSPLSRVGDIQAPVMLVQGLNDPRVPREHSEQIVAALRQREVPVQYLPFEDEGHGLAKPENRLAFYAIAQEFLATHIGTGNAPVQPTGVVGRQ